MDKKVLHNEQLSSVAAGDDNSHSETPTTVEATRTRLQIDQDDCVGCGVCANECPMHVIVPDGMYYRIGDGCIRCYACESVCPVGAVKETEYKVVVEW